MNPLFLLLLAGGAVVVLRKRTPTVTGVTAQLMARPGVGSAPLAPDALEMITLPYLEPGKKKIINIGSLSAVLKGLASGALEISIGIDGHNYQYTTAPDRKIPKDPIEAIKVILRANGIDLSGPYEALSSASKKMQDYLYANVNIGGVNLGTIRDVGNKVVQGLVEISPF